MATQMKMARERINRMQADGVIGQYAIGGAVGATLYVEPAATFDLDIFAILAPTLSSPLLSLTTIHEFLTARGGVIQDEYILSVRCWKHC